MARIDADGIERDWDRAGRRGPAARDTAPRRAAARGAADHPVGRVVGLRRGRLDVLVGGEVVAAHYSGRMRGQRVVVGDRVRLRPARHRTDHARVTEVLDRRTELLRTADDATDAERVVVANADQVGVVLAADHLDRGTGFLDRVLVAASTGRLEGLVVINRMDLVEEADAGAEIDEVAGRYRRARYPVVRTSAKTGAGLDDLRAALAGRWTVLCGHSGVGKSSLFNLLVPEADRPVGDTGRYGGRHTTVSAVAMRVDGRGDTWLVDTPGLRSFGLGTIGPEELRYHVPELAELACALPDCMHDGEPGCLVPNLGPERVHPARLGSYRRLLTTLRAGVAP